MGYLDGIFSGVVARPYPGKPSLCWIHVLRSGGIHKLYSCLVKRYEEGS
jgi:hypothetical protein